MAVIDGVRWLGGGSGAGKSTVAQRLVEGLGWQLYSSDDTMAEHAHRSDRSKHPFLAAFLDADMDVRWLHRSPGEMLDTFHWFRGEAFEMIVDDVDRLAAAGPVLVEGFRLLPRLVAPLLASKQHAVWMLPTPEFRRAAFEARGSLWSIADRTKDPEQALLNLLIRDAMFTDRLRGEVNELGLAAIEVDSTVREEHLVRLVATALGLDRDR